MTLFLFLYIAWQPESIAYQVPDVDVMAMNEDMRTFLDDMTSSHDEFRKLHTLVTTIFSESFLNLEYDNSRTKTAIETFEARSGNCLSFTFMFVAMARHLGIKASFQEIYNVPTWDRHGKMVVLNRHINARVLIDGKAYDVDFNPWADKVDFTKRVVRDSRAIAQYYNNIGAEMFTKRQFNKATLWFEKAVEVDNTVSFTWSNLGVAYRTQNLMDKAEFAYLRAIDLDKREYTAINNLSRLYEAMSRYEEAEHWAEKAETYRRRNPYYHFSLGEKAYASGNYEESVQHYRRAIRRKSGEHTFYHAIAKAYSKLEDTSKAKQYLRKAKAHAPEGQLRNRYNDKLDRLVVTSN